MAEFDANVPDALRRWDQERERLQRKINEDRLLDDPFVNSMMPLLSPLLERPSFWAFIEHLRAIGRLEAALYHRGAPSPEELATLFRQVPVTPTPSERGDGWTDFPAEASDEASDEASNG